MSNKGGRGRRTPSHLKAISGNPGKQTQTTPPDIKAAIPTLPRGFHKEGRKIYNRLAPLLAEAGLLTEADGPALADMCLCLARLDEAEAIIEAEGMTVPDGRGGVKRHPATMLAKEYRAAARQWAASFGLTPHARGSLDVKPTGGPVDPLQALLERR